MRVLIVDDNADIRLMVRMQVELLDGIESISDATNGVEAIEQARRGQPDVIILDLDMPVMTGTVALPGLRAAATGACIVVHTATSIDQAPGDVLAHADAYLQKMRDDVGDFLAGMLSSRRAKIA